jgi:hypothetical protein
MDFKSLGAAEWWLYFNMGIIIYHLGIEDIKYASFIRLRAIF